MEQHFHGKYVGILLFFSEFDRYHVSVGTGRQPPIIVGRDDPRVALFNEGLEPGRTYPVLVKTLSGNVASWPATANITTRKCFDLST